MKIAYIFSGHSRTWEKCYENFYQNIYNVMPGDIFIHTWDRTNAGTTSWWNDWNRPMAETLKNEGSKTPDFDRIKATYNPKKIIIEKDPSWDEIPHKWAIPKYENHPQWNHPQTAPRFMAKYILYAFKTIFDVAKEYDRYDRFFCSRLDINFLSKLDTKELENPNLVLSKTRHSRDNFRQDIFFHGNINYVELRSQYYDHIESYWYDHDYINVDFEIPLTNYFKDKNIPLSESNLQFNIPRITNTTSKFN